MVARISFPRCLEAVLRYNEQKVGRGMADCLAAEGYIGEVHTLDYHRKRAVLQRRNELNGRALTRTLHLSLNFHPTEQLSGERLCAIARAYMERIGFGEQPYLVYRHRDAAHPHLHVVSTLIRADGRRIPTHNLGRGASEKARREVEQLFGLVAAGQKRPMDQVPQPAGRPAPLVYGQIAIREGIAAIVHYVGAHHRLTSLPDFNAALRSYNVRADTGTEGSRIRKGGGLVYHVLGAGGKKVGVPLKASVLPGRPTLTWLRERFRENSDPHSTPLVPGVDDGRTTRGEREGCSCAGRDNDPALHPCEQIHRPEREQGVFPLASQCGTPGPAAAVHHSQGFQGNILYAPAPLPRQRPSSPQEEYVPAGLLKKKKRKGRKPSR